MLIRLISQIHYIVFGIFVDEKVVLPVQRQLARHDLCHREFCCIVASKVSVTMVEVGHWSYTPLEWYSLSRMPQCSS